MENYSINRRKLRNSYRDAKNMITRSVRKDIVNAKKMYDHRIFKSYRGDIKKTWTIINETSGRNKFRSELVASF